MILHPRSVLKAVYYAQRWRLKRFLHLPDRPHNPVLDGGQEEAYFRHLRICRLLSKGVASFPASSRRVACEIGSGDCLASAHFLLASGFDRIYLVEKQRITADQRQKDLLERISGEMGLPRSSGVFKGGDASTLDGERVRIIPEFFEFAEVPEKVDFIFSFDVVEHVENLESFFEGCARILNPDGVMQHKFDLSGHEFFEDPMPPLDFQTYPDWLYWLMFPRYRRACRRFLDEIVRAMEAAGFERPGIEVLRAADESYAAGLKPFFRAKAAKRTTEQLVPLDIVLTTRLAKRL